MTPREALALATRPRPSDASVDLRLAGSAIRLLGPSSLVDALRTALGHAAAPGTPDLVVHVGVDTLPPAAAETYVHGGGVHALRSPRVTSLLDPAGVGAWVVHGELPAWERGRPLRVLLGWWAAHRGLQLAHGAAVATPRGAVLLVGSGGAGKSTAAATCWLAGLPLLGDDQVVVGTDPPTAFPLYASVAATDHALTGRLAALPRAGAVSVPGDKTWCFLPDRVAPPTPLVAIAATAIGPETRWRPARAAEALLAVAAQSLLWQPGDRAAGLDRLATLVRRVPCFALTFGPEGGSTVDAVQAVAEAACSA